MAALRGSDKIVLLSNLGGTGRQTQYASHSVLAGGFVKRLKPHVDIPMVRNGDPGYATDGLPTKCLAEPPELRKSSAIRYTNVAHGSGFRMRECPRSRHVLCHQLGRFDQCEWLEL
jgi:hypothetical protein